MSKLSLRDLIYIAFFTALTTVGAWISIPVGPVPIVLANLFALLSGAVLGKWKGPLSQIVYLLMGSFSLPVFAGGSGGAGVIFGKTGGYLIGYVVASFITGALIEYLPGKLPLVLRLSVSLSVGAAAIYVPGIYWLSHVTGLDIPAALAVGLYPFIIGDAVKVVAGTMLCMSLSQVPQVWRLPTRD